MITPNPKRQPAYLSQYYITAVLLISLLIFNIFIWQLLKNQLRKAAERTQYEKTNTTMTDIQNYIHEYKDILLYGSALLDVHNDIDRTTFDRYFTQSIVNNTRDMSAFKSILYIEKVDNTEEFKKQIEKDSNLPLEDRLYFTIHPLESTPSYVVKYIAPFSSHRNLFGYNLATDQNQMKFIEKAGRQKTVVVSDKQILLNEELFVMYQAVYSDNNKTDIKGYLALTIEPKKLFTALESIAHGTQFSIYTSKLTASQLSKGKLYYRTPEDPISRLANKKRLINVIHYGSIIDQPLTFVFSIPANPDLPKTQQTMLNIFLYGGSFIIFTIFIIINLWIIAINKPRVEHASA